MVRLVLKEIWYRKLNFLCGLAAVICAVALFVAMITMSRASENETRRLMRDMGFNLLIVPKNTNMEDFWATDFAQGDMPEEYVRRLAATPDISAEHFVASLQQRIEWRGRRILLTGVLPELGRIGREKKSPMGLQVKEGTVAVGYELAASQNLKPGDRIEILGDQFTVARCLPESGSKDDIRIYTHLHDAQRLLKKEGRINTIFALGCICQGDSLATIREDIARILPETKVTEFRSIAAARAETRKMMERYALFIMPTVLVVCAAWVGVLALMNVRDRRREIGVLRALGLGSGRIAALFLGRALLMGLLGAAVGYALGFALASRVGPVVFKVTAQNLVALPGLFVWSLVLTPLVAGLASLLPVLLAVTEDPANILNEE